MTAPKKSEGPRNKRGFSAMDPALQREIASKGGRVAHEQGRAHQFNSEEARIAGRKGGEAVSRDRAHMAAIGQAGGRARGRNSALQAANERQDARAMTDSPSGNQNSRDHSAATPAE